MALSCKLHMGFVRTMFYMITLRNIAGRIGTFAFIELSTLSWSGKCRDRFLCSSSLSSSKPANVGIVGGGLAGLSVAYHLLDKDPELNLTVLDKNAPGAGGASAVAGGLVHPLSPKGKLVHLGLEGLAVTNSLVKAVREHRSDCVLQEEIYRVAVNDDHVSTLKQSAERLPELTQWVEARDLPMDCPSDVLGGLRLHSGCKVINVPSYLEGLWEVIRFTGTGWREWRVLQPSSDDVDWVNELKDFDTVVLSAGSGLFQDAIISEELPMQLVRGQSIEMTLNKEKCDFAMLCGKYISPLLEPSRILIGATHEFKEVPLDRRQVYSELRERSDAFASNLWEDGVVDNITSGVRVQSNRGPYGRLPMIGNFKSSLHSNAWIFTGLSSRGLIYHGLFGEILASRILNLETEYEQSGLDWWRNN